MVVDDKVTGTDVVRATLAAWAKKQNVAFLSRDIQVANEALYNFANGSGTLPPVKLQALTNVLFHGHAVYDPELDRLRHAPQPPPATLAPCRPDPMAGVTLPKFTGGPPPLYPAQKKSSPGRHPRPGWCD